MNTRLEQPRVIASAKDAAARVEAFDWERVTVDLDAQGNALLEGLLTPRECEVLAGGRPLRQADAMVFAVHRRPVQGKRGFYRVTMRHGVSRLRSGHSHWTGIIFHDAA